MNKLGILPITLIDGTPTVPDQVMRAVWFQMCAEDKAKTVFYDGYVNSVETWMAFIHSPANLAILIHTVDDPRACCVAWLNSFSGHFAFAHFCVLGKPEPGLGELVLQFWANLKNDAGKPFYDLILGLIPHSNQKAQRFVERLGFEEVGVIPKVCTMVYEDRKEPGVLYHFDLGRYRNGEQGQQ
jgi:hypothetical protein